MKQLNVRVGGAVLFAFCTLSSLSAATLYVSPDGDDAADGSWRHPLASLEGARDRVRGLRKTDAGNREAVTVLFADGEYRLGHPAVFEPRDSGTDDAPVVYRAKKWAKPVFFGGRRLPPFEAGADGVWRTHVEPDFRFEQLYVNGRRATRARSPNGFYYYMQAPAPYGIDPVTGQAADLSRRAFIASPADVAPLAALDPAALSNVVITVYHSWESSLARVQAVDPQTGRVVVTGSSPWPFFYWNRYLPRYHIENFKAALDAPGEWFLDADGTLSYLPLPDEKPGKTVAVAPVADAFLRVSGDALKDQWVSNVCFEGLTFAYAAYRLPANGQGDGQAAVSQPATVELDGARGICFRDCTFAHTGTHGVWFRKGCRDDALVHCRLYDLGGGAVRVGDSRWSPDELPDKLTGRITVDNTILHAGGRVFHGATGVWIGHASDVRVTHNDIGDFFYTGISMGWTWGYRETATHRNTLAFNHIHHIGWGVLSDMGGIYTLGRSDGTCISNNVIHDVYSYDYTGRGGWGLYTDEGSAEMVFENNLVYHTKTGSVHQHYGQDNLFRNNIFALSMNGQVQRSRIEDHTAFFFTNNIVYWDNDSAAFWRGCPASSPATDVVVNVNTYWNPNGIATNAFNGGSWEAWRAGGQDAASQIADPLFRNPANGDFRLRSGSPAVRLGFVPFDASQAGVYGSRAWRRLASAERYADVTFAPEPERYVVRRLDETFDALPLKAPFPNVSLHTEKKGDGIFVTDEAALSGRQSLKVQDAPDLKYGYDPHFFFSCALTGSIVENRFAVRMQPGAAFFTEWRDYPDEGGNGYAVGPSLVFRDGKVFARTLEKQADGACRGAERLVAELPADTWARVSVSADVGRGTGLWSVRVTRPGAPEIVCDGLRFDAGAFQRAEWLGFCSTAQKSVAFYLDDFFFGEKKK